MAPTSVFAPGNTALITGAASGIGLAVAKLCHKHGMKIALVDNNAANLKKADESFPSEDVESYQIDVSDLDAWTDLKSQVQFRFGSVDFLMLNAGIGLKGDWEDDDYFQKVSTHAVTTAHVR